MNAVSSIKKHLPHARCLLMLLALPAAGSDEAKNNDLATKNSPTAGQMEKQRVPGSAAKRYVVQLAAHKNLDSCKAILAGLDAPEAKIMKTSPGEGGFYVIIEGDYATLTNARTAADVIVAHNPGTEYWVRNADDPLFALEDDPPAVRSPIGRSVSRDYRSTHKNDRKREVAKEGYAIKVDELWLEYGFFPDSDSAADTQGYIHSQATANWSPNRHWAFQLAGRVDGYHQQGDSDADDIKFDYGESYARYDGGAWRITAGAQKILWGRIDEFPPTDRLSTQDLSRFILDDLADRRRASMALRFEHYAGNAKLDLMFIPFFREAELPEKDSVWFPVNKREGTVLGLKTTSISSEIVKNARIDLQDPDSAGGFGVRYSGLTADLDYGLSVQRGRQSVPYFTYNAQKETIETDYTRTWILGGDLAFETLGGTARFEVTWLSDTPVTRKITGDVSTVNSIGWGGSFEFFPGDGDARINLQIVGNNLLDTPNVLDRTDMYSFGGSYESPFANETWRFKTRFQIGLDEHDVYINPEIAYTGWYSQEVYIDTHYFDGSDGTVGGFHQDHSLITMGWRRKF